jgi:predicted transglutaminase-like cysteine proteinase
MSRIMAKKKKPKDIALRERLYIPDDLNHIPANAPLPSYGPSIPLTHTERSDPDLEQYQRELIAATGGMLPDSNLPFNPRPLTPQKIVLDDVQWKTIQQVNSAVNDGMIYAFDKDNYGKRDKFAHGYKKGDCEDFALTKYWELRKRGVPAEAMMIGFVDDDLSPKSKDSHAYLVIRTDQGDLVLNNDQGKNEIKHWYQVRDGIASLQSPESTVAYTHSKPEIPEELRKQVLQAEGNLSPKLKKQLGNHLLNASKVEIPLTDRRYSNGVRVDESVAMLGAMRVDMRNIDIGDDVTAPEPVVMPNGKKWQFKAPVSINSTETNLKLKGENLVIDILGIPDENNDMGVVNYINPDTKTMMIGVSDKDGNLREYRFPYVDVRNKDGTVTAQPKLNSPKAKADYKEAMRDVGQAMQELGISQTPASGKAAAPLAFNGDTIREMGEAALKAAKSCDIGENMPPPPERGPRGQGR